MRLHLPQGNAALKVLLFLAATTMLIVGGVFYVMLSGRPDGEPLDIVIERGKSAAAVSEKLAKKGVIEQPGLFKLVLRVTDGDRKVRAGEFRFRKQMRALDALHVLYFAEPILHSLTIPEGWTVRQIAAALAQAKLADERRFVSLALSREAAQKYGFKAPHLEGFLFPTTYQFSRIDSEERILDQMVSQFKRIYTSYTTQAEAKGISLEKVITMASIVEKETGVADERPIVASVFYNRLKKKMRLQSDPTTIYGISNFNGNLTKEDLRRYSPYNSYVIYGLPPGPIANPGEASIRAAINPAETDYLYFVSNNIGSHVFSKDYGQHSRHVSNTQGKPKKKRKAKR